MTEDEEKYLTRKRARDARDGRAPLKSGPPDDHEVIGILRRRCGLSVMQFAQVCGVSHTTVIAWERGWPLELCGKVQWAIARIERHLDGIESFFKPDGGLVVGPGRRKWKYPRNRKRGKRKCMWGRFYRRNAVAESAETGSTASR